MEKEAFTFLGSCPICSRKLKHEQASVVDKADDAVTLHIDCASCKSSLLLGVHSGAKGLVTTVGMPTDMKKRDMHKLHKHDARRCITSDDVLELHEFLEEKSA